MMQSADSGPLALPREDVVRRAGAASLFDVDTEPLTLSSRTRRPIGDVLAHPLNPAEVAQARLFAGMLRAEVAELEQRAERMAYRWSVRRDRDNSRQPEDLIEVRRRIVEARRLLETLQGRFLDPRRWEGTGGGRPSPRL